MKRWFSSQRAKKNLINVGIIALVIAIVIMLNAIITILGSAFGWYGDMTDEQLYTISDALKETLNGANMNVDVEIIFCCAKDYAQSNFSNLDSGDALAYVHRTATEIAKEYKNVSVIHRDPAKEPDFFKNNFTEIERFLSGIDSPVIVARRGDDGKYGTHFKVYAARSFYGFASSNDSLYAYVGEKVFASAILSLTLDETPAVYFATGHSERIYNEVNNQKTPITLVDLFHYSGFKVEELNLIESDIPADARMVVVNEPQFDLHTKEIEKLDKYMSNKGSVMIFANPDYSDKLPRLYSFLEARAGVCVNTEGKIKDEKSNVTTDKLSFRAEISSNSAAGTYLAYLSDYTSAKPFFSNSASVTIKDAYLSDEGVYEGDSYTYTQPLFQTAQSGEYKGVKGNHLVMSVTSILKGKTTGDAYSYLVFCPSSGFASDEALGNQAYPNEDIILSLVHSMTSVQTSVDVDFKKFANYDLDITEAQAKTATVILALVVPMIAIAVGSVVLYRRKRR